MCPRIEPQESRTSKVRTVLEGVVIERGPDAVSMETLEGPRLLLQVDTREGDLRSPGRRSSACAGRRKRRRVPEEPAQTTSARRAGAASVGIPTRGGQCAG